ncbi:hypothetical protein Tco_1318909 [Tanacetum coccineum]
MSFAIPCGLEIDDPRQVRVSRQVGVRSEVNSFSRLENVITINAIIRNRGPNAKHSSIPGIHKESELSGSSKVFLGAGAGAGSEACSSSCLKSNARQYPLVQQPITDETAWVEDSNKDCVLYPSWVRDNWSIVQCLPLALRILSSRNGYSIRRGSITTGGPSGEEVAAHEN